MKHWPEVMRVSKYTTQVRFVCEQKAGYTDSVGFSGIDTVLEKSWNKIFTTKCNFFDESYRAPLCKKILKHFYLREIGSETVGEWQYYMNALLEEIMPFYNQLYESELLRYNPLQDTDITTTRKIDTSGTDNQKDDRTTNSTRTDDLTRIENRNITDTRTDDLVNTTQGTNLDLYHDTPQGNIGSIGDTDYLSNLRKISNNATDSSTGTQEVKGTGDITTDNTGTQSTDTTDNFTGKREYQNTDEYLENVTGKRGTQSFSKLVKEFRENMLNIDMMVINEFEACFMGIW